MGYSFNPVYYDSEAIDVVVELLAERKPLERAIELAMILQKLEENPSDHTDKNHAIHRRIPKLMKLLCQRNLMTRPMEIMLTKFCIEVGITRD